MAVIAVLQGGIKLVEVEISAENTGTSAADVSASATVGEVSRILGIVGYYREDTKNSGVTISVTLPNTVNVTFQSVPAGETTKVKVTLLGY